MHDLLLQGEYLVDAWSAIEVSFVDEEFPFVVFGRQFHFRTVSLYFYYFIP
jgi:hypothetical protein